MVWRHPFPGPGLGVRILGEVTWERLELRAADAIFLEELRAAGLYRQVAQAFAVLLPVRSVGVMGDGRTYAERDRPARRHHRRLYDRRLGAAALRPAGAGQQPHRQRGRRGQPRGLRHQLQAAGDDRVGINVAKGFSMNAVVELKPSAPWDVECVRRDFPILAQEVHGHPLAYLDNAATTQKPRVVIEAMDHYYRHDNANVHRGVHALAERATTDFEAARETVRRFINARSTHEIVFLRGTTEAINLVASSFGQGLREGDEVILTTMEHHANIVPWQLLRERTGIVLRVLPIAPQGELDLDALPGLFSARTRLLAVTHVSNALGTVNPVEHLIAEARERDVPVLLDGAQAVPHLRVDVQALEL
jgi:hypothetical protein